MLLLLRCGVRADTRASERAFPVPKSENSITSGFRSCVKNEVGRRAMARQARPVGLSDGVRRPLFPRRFITAARQWLSSKRIRTVTGRPCNITNAHDFLSLNNFGSRASDAIIQHTSRHPTHQQNQQAVARKLLQTYSMIQLLQYQIGTSLNKTNYLYVKATVIFRGKY